MFEAIGDWVVNGNRNATFKCDQEGVQRSMNSSRGAMQSEFVVVAADEKARLHCAKINLEPGAGRGDRAKPDPTIAAAPASSAWRVVGVQADMLLFSWGRQREG